MDLQRLRVGYVPISSSLDEPGDRRRFVHYARTRGVDFEIADTRKDYDVVVLSERADVSVWSEYGKGRAKIVYDLIDSYLATPRTSVKGRLRGLAKFVSRQSRSLRLDHWKAIEAMCRRSDAVVCSTAEQERDIARFCSNVHIILDAHANIIKTVKQNYAAGEVFNLVWEGLGINAASLFLIRDVLKALKRKHTIALHLVTDLEYPRYLGKYVLGRTTDLARQLFDSVYFYQWNEQLLSRIITGCDLALIPLDLDDPFSAGKPENKLLLFWRMGMPTVTSASPANKRAMSACGLDMACTTEREWLSTLERYIKDELARENAGRHGRAYAEKHYSQESMLAKWDAVFSSIL